MNVVIESRTMLYVCPVSDVKYIRCFQGISINPGNTMGVNLIHSVYLKNLLEFSERN